MAMPMAGEAMQIVNKSLETGARGYSQKETDYSGLSDAFMKKASLETQIGGMLMDQNMNRATLLSQMEMNKAEIYMQGAQLAQREDHFNREMKAREDADKMSPFEQITGVLAGAAGPAAAGYKIGGPKGALIGGAIGAAGTLAAGNSRTRQSSTIQNIGAISEAAVAIKGFSDQRKASDSSSEMIKGVGSIAGIFRNSAPNSEEFQGAQRQLDTYVDKYTQEQIKLGRPMGEVYKEAAAIKKEAMQGFDPSDKQMVANRNIAGLIAEAKTDKAFMRGDRKAIENFQMKAAGFHMEAYGEAPTRADMQIYTGRVDPVVAQGYYRGNSKSISAMPAPSGGSGGGQVSSQGTGSTAQGVTTNTTGTSGGGTTSNTPPQMSQDGRFTPNYVVPGANPAGNAMGAWGMEPDSGPTELLQSAQANFNQAAFKDPSIVDKALNREPEVEPGWNSQSGLQDKMAARGRNKALAEGKLNEDAPSNAPMEVPMHPSGVSKPNITSEFPENQVKEEKFKTITSIDGMKREMGLEGKKFAKDGERQLVMGTAKTAAQVNALEKDLLSPESRAMIDSLPPEARKELIFWAEGQGEGAMLSEGFTAAASGLGVSGQIGKNKFEKNNRMSLEDIGERHKLSKEQMSWLNNLRTRIEGNARDFAMTKNKGQLTAEDVKPWRASIANIFEQDSAVGVSGLNPVKDMLWNTFYMEGDAVETIDQTQTRKNNNKSPGSMRDTSNDPWMPY